MGRSHRKLDPQVQQRLGELPVELRHIIYGEHGHPE